ARGGDAADGSHDRGAARVGRGTRGPLRLPRKEKARVGEGAREVKGTQRKFTCPKCGKGFTAWRPDELPGVPVKCYFCGNQFEDEAAKRKPAAPPPAPAGTPAAPASGEAKAN